MANKKLIGFGATGAAAAATAIALFVSSPTPLDTQLTNTLAANSFTGRIEGTLAQRLGRPLQPQLADLGRNLWFDKILALDNDNACAGCHSPTNAFGDTQSIAIGVDNNNLVGPGRIGPRNMRKTPQVINVGFYPNLMLNSRFIALSGNPFNNVPGWSFPAPEGASLSYLPQLIVAQAFTPPTEQSEMAGFSVDPDHTVIRAEVVARLNANLTYRQMFSVSFPTVAAGGPIDYNMLAKAIAEFQFSLTFTNSPLDRFARGELSAMTEKQKRGALLFFGAAKCVLCHAVSGGSNEMFSDFQDHVIGVPQLVPSITNVQFDGPGANEDFGLEDLTGNPADRYKFRTPPIRNAGMQPAFFHDGAFTRLEAAIRHHLNAVASATAYTPASQHIAVDLSGPMGPLAPILARLDPLLATPISLTTAQFDQLVDFVREGILDPRARPGNLIKLVPDSLPSGSTPLLFQF